MASTNYKSVSHSPFAPSVPPPSSGSNGSALSLQFKIVQFLERNDGFAFRTPDLENKTGIKDILKNTELLDILRRNESVEIGGTGNELLFRWKKKYPFRNKAQFIEWLKENKKIVISDDVERQTYPDFKKDVQDLHLQRRVLKFSAREGKRMEEDLYFWNDVILEREISSDVRRLWEQSYSHDMHIHDIRVTLKKANISVADVKFENKPITIPIRTKKERGKRKRDPYQRKANPLLDSIELPEEFTLFGELDQQASKETGSGSGSGSISTSAAVSSSGGSEEGQAIAISKGKSTPQHLLSALQKVVRTFYTDEMVIVFDCIAQLGPTKDSKLADDLGIQPEQIRGAMFKMQQQLLMQHLEVKEEATKKRSGLWFIDFNEFVDVVNFRLLRVKNTLSDQINKKENLPDFCRHCHQKFHAADMMTLLLTQACPNCKKPLEEASGTIDIEECRRLQRMFDTEMMPVKSLLAPLNNQEVVMTDRESTDGAADSGQTAALMPPGRKLPPNKRRKPNAPASTPKPPVGESVPGAPTSRPTSAPGINNGRTAPSINPYKKQEKKDSKEEVKSTEPAAADQSNNLVVLSKPITTNFVVEHMGKYDYGPIYYHRDGHYLLPLLHKSVKKLKWSTTIVHAHKLLCLIGELKLYYSQVFDFTITPLSLYVARTRSYTADEIINVLRIMTRSLPQDEIHRIKQICSQPYFKASISLRNNRYCVESESRNVVSTLSVFSSFPKAIREATDTSTVPATTLYFFEIDATECEGVRRYGVKHNIPVIDKFAYATDISCPTVNMKLKYPETRDYQKDASERMFWEGHVHSGLLILPCGAGKTYCGVNISTKIRKNVIVFCTSTLAATQWKEQFKKWSTINPKEISKFTSDAKSEWESNASVVISTYSMFASTTARSGHSLAMINQCKARTWGLMILDEVHLAPADTFRKVTTEFRSHVKLGLTATMIREDGLIEDLPFLVGPKLYEVDLLSLRANKYIATIHCTEIKIPLTEKFKAVYSLSDAEKKKLLFITNPNKVLIVNKLIQYHFSRGHKILVFSDDLFGLEWFGKVLKKAHIDGSTPTQDREVILDNFRKSQGGNFVLQSKVGNISIGLSEANVLTQIGIVDRSRMQEAQRVGRIQRSVIHTETFFYSLLSQGTSEEEYVLKRRTFMEEHGYRYEEKRFDDYVDEQFENIPFQQELLALIDNCLTDRKNRDEPGYSSLMAAQQKQAAKESEAGKLSFSFNTGHEEITTFCCQ